MDLGSLAWPEGLLAIAIGIGGGIALLDTVTLAQRREVVGDSLQLLGVLLGVVIAAFALLIALFSDRYVRLLEKAKDGIIAFLRPFMIAAGCQVTAVFVAISYRASAAYLGTDVEKAFFLTWAFLFSFAMLDVVALTRNVMLHGLLRAGSVGSDEDDREATVHNLHDRPG
jgi:hypothetical protein